MRDFMWRHARSVHFFGWQPHCQVGALPPWLVNWLVQLGWLVGFDRHTTACTVYEDLKGIEMLAAKA
jgi:hypothetical protein